MSRGRTLPVLLAAVALAVLVAGCGSSGGGGGRAAHRFENSTVLPKGLAHKPAPRIRLTDARGGTLDTGTYAGMPYLVTFLYTDCPDVCPLIGEEIRQALDQLGPDAARVRVVAVSVDPRHDDAAAVQRWLALHKEPSEFHYGIGSERQLAPIWRAWFAAPQIPGDPNSAHSAVVWLVDSDGRIATNLDAGGSFDPAALAHDIRVLLA